MQKIHVLIPLLLLAMTVHAARSRVDCEIIVGSKDRQPPDPVAVEQCYLQSKESERLEALDIEAAKSAHRIAEEEERRDREKRGGVRIGMSRQQALQSNWGKPDSVHTTTTATTVVEQWVYGGGGYLYFRNGRLYAIQN